MDSPRRIGTSSSNRRTTKRSISSVRRLSAHTYLLALPVEDLREILVDYAGRGRDESLHVAVERDSEAGPDVRDHGQQLHHLDARQLVERSSLVEVALRIRPGEQVEERLVLEAELRRLAPEVDVQEIGRIGKVGDPTEQEQLVLAGLNSRPEVGPPRRRVGDDVESGLVEVGRERLEVVRGV